MTDDEIKEHLDRAPACFCQAHYWRDLGNEILRPVRERRFKPAALDAHGIIDIEKEEKKE